MAFEGLTEKLSGVFKKLRSKGRLTEADVKAAMREIRLALLEADVSFKVVKDFVQATTEKCVGSDVLESLTPAQMIVKIVNQSLTELMGSDNQKIAISPKPPTIVMLVGLQGAGKTTNGAKLAGYMKKQGKHPLLVACDVYRPAAIRQLEIVGEKLDIPVFQMGQGNPVDIAKAGVAHAEKHGLDMVFLDTAGRLHIDEALMQELQAIQATVHPTEVLLVVDAMTGQDAVNVAQTFNEQLNIDGVMLTKLDGDARGGAALSVKAVTGKPIKFAGTGEKLEDIEPFHPDRMASRILGMGDVLTLIEKAEAAFDQKKAAEMEQKLRSSKFTLQDFYGQLVQLKSMGNLQDMLGMMPGMGNLKNVEVDEKAMGRTEAIILSMTPHERENPNVLNHSRKRRIAAGAGVPVEEINKLLKQFETMQALVRQMSGPGAKKRMRGMSKFGGGMPGGFRLPGM
ncbi:MAG: signal recognition particle protein [Clostridiales bacterium]|nr:signal recognition particle protein [Clostridiales bacterium]